MIVLNIRQRSLCVCQLLLTGVYLNNTVTGHIELNGTGMSAKDSKVKHQRLYQQRVDAVRNGQLEGRVMEKRPDGIVPCKNPRPIDFF